MKLSEKKLQELKEKKILIEKLNEKYFYTKKDGVNVEIVLKLLNENIWSFGKIVDKFKNLRQFDLLLENTELLEELIQNNKLTKDDTRYFLNKIDNWSELDILNRKTTLLKHIVDKNLLSFKELIDKYKSIKNSLNDPCLYKLLETKELFEELIQNNLLNIEDTRYLLNRIDRRYELNKLCDNTSLIEYILTEFMLNREIVDKLNRMIKKDYWCKRENIHTLFEYIEYRNKNNEEEILKLSKLNELNKKVCTFDLNEDQRDELSEALKNNEIAQNRLIQIVENHLESNYDFESLMRYLKKKEKKNILNI